jgi:hypothetical protein
VISNGLKNCLHEITTTLYLRGINASFIVTKFKSHIEVSLYANFVTVKEYNNGRRVKMDGQVEVASKFRQDDSEIANLKKYLLEQVDIAIDIYLVKNENLSRVNPNQQVFCKYSVYDEEDNFLMDELYE